MASYPAAEAEQWPQTHHTTTSMFDCWCEVLFMKYCTSFTLDVSGNKKKEKKKKKSDFKQLHGHTARLRLSHLVCRPSTALH